MAVMHNDKLDINIMKHLNNNDYDDQSYKNDKAAHLHGRKPKRIRFFANGDKFFQGKKISVHSHKYQNIEDLLTELTNKMPPQVYLPNGIRQIFSPNSGRRITEIDQLENERDYVCAGNESFKSISYGLNPREPWFKGRPHFSRYPQLIPFGLGSVQSIKQSLDSNGHQKIDSQSNYAGQNAFPTRFYRPTGPAYLSKNMIGQLSSVSYPKLIKFRSKGSYNQNSSYYQELLTQQVKPKVITVVKGGPESPKSFVRILLNKRSVQSYETLVTDIETSLRDQSQQKLTNIGRIYNLFNKEIKSVADFFKSDDFFIATGDQDHLGSKQVKEILDDMYPDHPQTEQILQYWGVKRVEISPGKENVIDQEKTHNFHGSNISVDKRDSGFEEQDFSKESDFTSNVNSSTDKELPKPKPLKNKTYNSRKKKNAPKNIVQSSTAQKEIESDFTNVENSTSRYSPTTYRKIVQERNAERLRAAYEERENARIQIQEQLKAEKKRIEDYSLNNGNFYSQYVRKSINDKGSIDVFKKMDDASRESRKEKLRQKLEKQSRRSSMTQETTDSHFVKGKKSSEEFPSIEASSPSNIVNKFNIKDSEKLYPVQTDIYSSIPQLSPPTIRKLNKIAEAPNESNLEDFTLTSAKRKESLKIILVEKPSRTETSSISLKVMKDVVETPVNDSEVIVKSNDLRIVQEDIPNLNDNKENENSKEDKKDIDQKSSMKLVFQKFELKEKSISKVKSNHTKNDKDTFTHKDSSKSKPTKIIKSVINVSKEMAETSIQPLPEKSTEINNKPSGDKLPTPVPKKSIIRQISFPGNRVMGKLCRQISSPQIVYQRFETLKVLGDGNFAVVKMVLLKENKKEYALKIIDKSKMRGKESMIENEIWIMKLCNHENIIKLKEEYESREEVFLVMELIKGGDLFDAITQSVKFGEPVASRMVIDMANALFYLHSRQIVHRDLKPENLMVLRHRDGSMTLKLADFGLAMEVKKMIKTVCGTPTYVAPEILTEQGYSLEVDLWALGVITYILLCGFPPFRSPKRDQDQLFELIKSGNFEFVSPYWDTISYDVKDLISKLLVVDRKLRYTTIQVLSHRWILSKGGSTSVSEETKRRKMSELEEEAKLNLEDFQRKKKEFRQTINREIQAAYASQNK